MNVYDIEHNKPENGAECIVWMGTWWRHVTYYEGVGRGFYTGDGDKLRYKAKLWFYAPAAVVTSYGVDDVRIDTNLLVADSSPGILRRLYRWATSIKLFKRC